MHREGYIIEEITEYGNMSGAFDAVLRGTKRKNSKQGKELLAAREQVISELTEQIRCASLPLGDFYEREIREYGKVRRLQIFSIRVRIAIYAIMNVVDRHLHRRYIRTTGASIKERGTHDLMKRVRSDLQQDPEGTRYAYQFDVRKFYDSILPEHVMYCFRRVIKDERLMTLMERFVTLFPKGISFGLRSSQAAGNLLLSTYLDHVLKDGLGVRHYYRYCDDGLVLSADKRVLWKVRDKVHEQIGKIDLQIKPSERVYPVSGGIDFLGYVIYPDHVCLRKRIKKRFSKRVNRVKSRKRRAELLASFYGMAKHADCRNLYNKLCGKEMKSFKDLNITYKPEDGKKRFSGSIISIRELVNLTIQVHDFESGVKTGQGEDRYIVSITANGESRKFFTNSEEMKNILEQVREKDGFPFETVIRSEQFGKGKTKYIFT